MAPTIILIPGAWHPKETMSLLEKSLTTLNIPVISLQLASVGSSTPKLATVATDAAQLRGELSPLLEQGLDLVIVAHSYAGCPVSDVLREFAAKTRGAKGLKGGVVGCVYMTAFVLPDSVSVQKAGRDKLGDWVMLDEEEGTCFPNDPDHVFYEDLERREVERCVALLQKQSLTAFRSGIGDSGHNDAAYDGRRAYIYCEDDNAISISAQKAMVEGTGVKWETKTIKASHSPFVSRPDEVAEYLAQLVAKWEKL